MRKITVSPAVIIGHSETLKSNNTTAKYPFLHTEVKVASISRGQTSFIWENIYLGAVPSRFIVGIVKDEAMAGDFKLNPYNFAGYSVTSVAATLDGQYISGQPYKVNFEENEYISAYVRLKESTINGDFDNGLEREDFGGGYALYAFDVEPDFDFDYSSLIRKGNVRLQITFSKPLETTLAVVIYSESPTLLEIDASRNIIYEPQ
jgi:hypothetical protein